MSNGNVIVMGGALPPHIKEALDKAFGDKGGKAGVVTTPVPAPSTVNLGVPGPNVETEWDLLPKKMRKKIQHQYMKQLKKPANANKTSDELMAIVGQKMGINFQIED